MSRIERQAVEWLREFAEEPEREAPVIVPLDGKVLGLALADATVAGDPDGSAERLLVALGDDQAKQLMEEVRTLRDMLRDHVAALHASVKHDRQHVTLTLADRQADAVQQVETAYREHDAAEERAGRTGVWAGR
jgi:hypothetical protein